jgi:hypothetical protein
MLRGPRFWKIFNALGRFVGLGFLVVGSILALWGLEQREWLIAVPGIVVAILGCLLLVARPYRPDRK